MAKVSFLGLGVMGSPMAGHLAKAGHDMTVYNRTGAKAQDWAGKHGGRAAATPKEAASRLSGAAAPTRATPPRPPARIAPPGRRG